MRGRLPAVHAFEFGAMGTRGLIRVHADTAARAADAMCRAVQEIERLEEKYSRYRPGNFMHRLNQVAAAGGSLAIDGETALLLRYADQCHEQSDGLFDITSGVLRRCWNFQDGAAPMPDPAEIERTLPRVGWRHVQVSDACVRFGRPGMELDFGGVVKEHAVDRAAEICRGHGLRHGVVDLGGDIRIVGAKPDGGAWVIGVQHPRRPDAEVGQFSLCEGGLATSGDYARCVQIGGRRYSHILCPRTGWPVQGLASATVAAESCLLAGSASTIAMLRQRDGPQWLEMLALPHLWVDLDGRVGGRLS